MATASVNIYLGPVSRFWCDGCLTTAGLHANMLTMNEHGVTKIGEIHKCRRCDLGVE